MPDPFRQLATTPTADALAKLRAMPVDPIRYACELLVDYREVGQADAPANKLAAARNEKMTYLGAASEGLGGAFKKQIFVDEAGTTQVHISMTNTFFATYFESGKCILTWDHPPATQSNDRLRSRSGSGDFSRDYESHRQAVLEWVDAGENTIVVRDIETAVALGRFYYRHVIAQRNAWTLVYRHPIVIVSFGILIWLIIRIL
jgi:hypothetical protein